MTCLTLSCVILCNTAKLSILTNNQLLHWKRFRSVMMCPSLTTMHGNGRYHERTPGIRTIKTLSSKAQQLINLAQRRKSDAKCWNHWDESSTSQINHRYLASSTRVSPTLKMFWCKIFDSKFLLLCVILTSFTMLKLKKSNKFLPKLLKL